MSNENHDFDRWLSQQFKQPNQYIYDDGFTEGVLSKLPKKKEQQFSTMEICSVFSTLCMLAVTVWNLPAIGWYYDFTSWFLLEKAEGLSIVAAGFSLSVMAFVWVFKARFYYFLFR